MAASVTFSRSAHPPRGAGQTCMQSEFSGPFQSIRSEEIHLALSTPLTEFSLSSWPLLYCSHAWRLSSREWYNRSVAAGQGVGLTLPTKRHNHCDTSTSQSAHSMIRTEQNKNVINIDGRRSTHRCVHQCGRSCLQMNRLCSFKCSREK